MPPVGTTYAGIREARCENRPEREDSLRSLFLSALLTGRGTDFRRPSFYSFLFFKPQSCLSFIFFNDTVILFIYLI